MKMKQLLRYTSTIILRTALLFGAIAFVNTQIMAQPVSLTAEMPDAFEAKNPVIGDGEYYYVQFYKEETYSPYIIQSFLGELGEGVQMQAMDYLPFAPNRLWTLVAGSDATHFKLKSKRGFYAYYTNNRFFTTATEANATEFSYKDRGSYRAGFKELLTSDGVQMGRWSGGGEWSQMINVGSNNQIGFVRFAKLKPTAAHIIYYRQDGADNSDPQASTIRHYLTYSDTDNRSDWNFRSSTVSSRRSIIPGDKSLWTLPTAAVYHQDGLWALEETGNDGEFFIKKHGTEEYLNPVHDDFDYLNLGVKDNVLGKYSLETPTANRYSRVQNVSQQTEPLTASMFYIWDGYGADATSTGQATVDSHFGEQITADQATNGFTVIGDGNVSETTFANLSNYDKMTINGTPDMQLRVLMSRQGYGGRPWAEKIVTIGNDGKAEVELTNLTLNSTTTGSATVKATYINGYYDNNVPADSRDISYGEISTGNPVYCGRNKFTGGYVDLYNHTWSDDAYIAYLQVDASAFNGTIKKVTLKGNFRKISTNGRQMEYGVGYNSTPWSSTMTWNNADRSITTMGSTQLLASQDGEEELSFEITDAFTSDPSNKIKTILVYNLTAGNGYIKNPTVEVEYYPTVSYPHLNAIKTNWGSSPGTINSITLTKTSSQHLHHADGDGWQAMLWGEDHTGDWYAGFYPVEVPVSQKDEFFEVRLLVTAYGLTERKQPIYLENMTEGMTRSVKLEDESHNIIGAAYTPTGDFQRCFRLENLAVPSGYNRIVIRFAEPVTGNWNINGYVNGQNGAQTYERIPEGSLYYEMDLREDPTNENSAVVSPIVDFTIFNWEGERSPISIAEVYFYSGTMVNNETGGGMASSEGFPSLWELEQVDDYSQFRLKNPNTGKYLVRNGVMTDPNDPTDAEINPNEKFWTDFSPKWYIPTESAEKEIRLNHYVRHKESYLRKYADDQVIADQEGLRKQGLSRDIDSDWKETENKNTGAPFLLDGFIQNTNYFEITHYLKKGSSRVIEFPTVLNKNNDHIYFQRFYNYDVDDTEMDLEDLKAHVSLNTRDDGDVQYFLYNNGMVTGQKLKWTNNDGTAIPDGGMARNEQRRFNFTNSDGQSFTVGVDVSRYSDLEYKDNTNHLDDDLIEPSLTMRYLFNMHDAKVMAANLTACPEGSGKWLENKEFHFGRTQVPYTKFKKVGYRGEFLPIRHIFSDYWVYDDPQLIKESYLSSLGLSGEALNDYLDQHLVSAVNDNRSGKIEVEVVPNGTGIRKGGYNPNIDLNSEGTDEGNEDDYQNFYMYDLLSPSPKYDYGNSRFTVFRYPESGIVDSSNPAYINVYLNADGRRYQIAHYTLYFDANMATRPWTRLNNGTSYANNVNQVKGTSRDPNQLRARAGQPIAKVSFDFPQKMKISGTEEDATYHYPSTSDCPSTDGVTCHDGGTWDPDGTIGNSSPVPLTFGHTNYSFDGDGCNWGAYALVTGKTTTWGNGKTALPADDDTYGYGLPADPGMQKAFMYIDASEQPGDICAVEFEGEFCTSDQLMCTGWISGSNRIQGDTRCPGSITLTVKGEDADGSTKTIYRFCPGQIYELDNGYGNVGQGDDDIVALNGAGIDGNGNGATHVVWQQFYFEFSTDRKYERYWLEVNNNCVSSNGGDFMLDNVEVYALVPEVVPEMNTPICVDKDGEVDLKLLRLDVDYNKLKNSSASNKLGFVFLEKNKFLNELKRLHGYSGTIDLLAAEIAAGTYVLSNSDAGYHSAFDAALLREPGNTSIWESSAPGDHLGAGIMYFEWENTFEDMPLYSFYNAVGANAEPIYRYTNDVGEDFIVVNGNYPQLPWKANTDYYIIPSNEYITAYSGVYSAFNICSECSKASVFRIDPPYEILGLDQSEDTNEYVVCEGQIPTLVTNLKGYDITGHEVPMQDLNYDWWLGDLSDVDHPVFATIENFHTQSNGSGIKLDRALSALRWYYPDVTSLDGLLAQSDDPNPELTLDMIRYLQSLVNKGQLVLHQKSISVPALKASEDDPYFYLVACPIHDDAFVRALNPEEGKHVTYFCDEAQGLRVKVGDKAPTLMTGFVPGENTFPTYDYSAANDAVLSIRLAKAAQFEEVQHGDEDDEPSESYNTTAEADKHFLWLPIRNAQTKIAGGVIRKSSDYNIYLASTNDPTWDKNIYTSMTKILPGNKPAGKLPIVGKIVKLQAKNINGSNGQPDASLIAAQNGSNYLCIYFTENFEVREGYSYTLSLPFEEAGDVNACDGTILINLKIVPDYEVWTGAAGNTDWNNDENWRRADGNTTSTAGLNADELYVKEAVAPDPDNSIEGSPLYGYKTNAWNYRTPKDRVFRKGFAPLYCTHVLLKGDEWGNAPVLYDALDNKATLTASPFPNLRDADDWDGNDAPATATPILRYDMQARLWDIWSETYDEEPEKGRSGDLLAEMYQVNCCDEIVFQPGTELMNAHLLNYNNAWVEYKLDNKRWYLLGSPLQGTISGEWYAPNGTAQQNTTYYDPVRFNDKNALSEARYDRYSPAIYQRSWDKAKAVLYEFGSEYSTSDDNQTQNIGVAWAGHWDNGTWLDPDDDEEGTNAAEYLDRLGYKPMGGNKANVAIKGIWSNTYNDATVDYANGGFSVMVLNHLKGDDQSGDVSIIRLPKEDTMYDYYKYSENGADDGGTDTYLIDRIEGDEDIPGVQSAKNRAKNRGRLKTDKLLPASTYKTEATASIYGDARTYTRIPIREEALTDMNDAFESQSSDAAGIFTETIPTGATNLVYYLVENPFPCGLNMDAFFRANPDLVAKYWLLTADGQHLVQKAADSNEWISPTVSTSDGDVFAPAKGVVAPGQAFFVEAVPTASDTPVENITIAFNRSMQAQTRFGVESGSRTFTVEVGQKQKTETVTETVTLEDGTTETITYDKPLYEADGVTPQTEPIEEDVTIYNYVQDTGEGKEFPLLSRRTLGGETVGENLPGMVITVQRGDSRSGALVMQREQATNDFLPSEDTEVFINDDLKQVPTVYTLCGRLATAINTVHDFRCLPLGVESASDAPCTLTFQGVELLGDSIAFYDAVEQTLTPLESGMQFNVSGQTQNRYYLVRTLNMTEVAEETHLQIFTEGLMAKVIASTAEPILSVRCYDTAGQLIHTATPQTPEYSFTLPREGVYIIEAQTANDRKTKKVMTK